MKAAEAGTREIGAHFQQVFDRTFAAAAGLPIAEVTSRLKAEADRAGMDLSEKQLQDFAQCISARIQVRVTP